MSKHVLARLVQLAGQTCMDTGPLHGLIWTILYPIIAVSLGYVFVQVFRKKLPRKTALPFAINLVSNLLFMPIFAGLNSIPLATVDILVVWSTTIWCVIAVRRHYRWVAIAQGPYFLWVSIAAVLQLSITAMNWGRLLPVP